MATDRRTYQGCSGNPKVPEHSENSEAKGRIWPHHFRFSPDCVPHMEKVFSIVRKIYDRKPTDNLKDLDVNTAIWCIFMSVTLQAAVHLGRDYSLNLRSVKNQCSNSVEQLFRTTEKLIKEQTEITGLSTFNWDQPIWRESSLLCERAVRIMKSQTYVFADSVPCLGGISTAPVKACESKIEWFLETRYFKDLDRIDGEPMDFAWKNFPGFITLGILIESQCEPGNSQEGSSSCRCTMTLIGENEETKKIVLRMLSELLCMLEDSREDIGRFWCLDRKRNGAELMSTNLMENRRKLLKA